MRLSWLAVVLLLGGCRQSAPPEPAMVLELPPSPGKPAGAKSTSPEAASEPESQPQSQPPPAEQIPEQTWTARSADGSVEVRQTALRAGKAPRCTSLSTVAMPSGEWSVMWQWDTCIATREQLKFVSPDGKRVLVLEPLPASIKGHWKDVEVATLYEHGLRVRGVAAGAVIGLPEKAQDPAHFAWVKGQAGLPGTPPRYTSDGTAVELETADGHQLRLGFEGGPSVARMYQYVDGKGTSHFVDSLGVVPARYRSRAVPVEAEVGILPSGTPLEKGEPAPALSTPESPGTPEDPRLKNPARLLGELQEKVKNLGELQEKVKNIEESHRAQEQQLDSVH